MKGHQVPETCVIKLLSSKMDVNKLMRILIIASPSSSHLSSLPSLPSSCHPFLFRKGFEKVSPPMDINLYWHINEDKAAQLGEGFKGIQQSQKQILFVLLGVSDEDQATQHICAKGLSLSSVCSVG